MLDGIIKNFILILNKTFFCRYVFIGIFGPILLLILFAILISLLQVYAPKFLPYRLQTWSWLPRPFHTLAWYDEHIFSGHKRLICCNGNESKQAAIIINQNMEKNSSFNNKTFDDNDDSDRLSGITTTSSTRL